MISPRFCQATVPWKTTATQTRASGENRVSTKLGVFQDAEDATIRQALDWAAEHDPAAALRPAGALGWWWFLRGKLAGNCQLLREAAGRASPGSDGWCSAMFWLGYTVQ